MADIRAAFLNNGLRPTRIVAGCQSRFVSCKRLQRKELISICFVPRMSSARSYLVLVAVLFSAVPLNAAGVLQHFRIL